MVGWYINSTSCFDTHPPLGKMLISSMGYTTGYNATLPFQPGDEYLDHDWLGMRLCCTLTGLFLSFDIGIKFVSLIFVLSGALRYMVRRIAFGFEGYASAVIFEFWAMLTASLCLMEGLSTVLHTLGLQWVKFR